VKVIVIGCGPAGLAAAHAASAFHCETVVYAPYAKTPQQGPLLLQRPIPGISTGHPDGTIWQRVIGGSILDYRYRLYGDINIGINGDMLKGHYHAWNHGEAYDKMWNLYHHIIEDRLVQPTELKHMHEEADLVVSTANASTMCRSDGRTHPFHAFVTAQVAITPIAMYPAQPSNTIIFNGGDEYKWARSSRIFGSEVTEWSMPNAPQNARVIQKPISTDCDCYPHVLRTGRFGAWKNEVWVDTAYWDTYTALASMIDAKRLGVIK
jgi:hypothetical protein